MSAGTRSFKVLFSYDSPKGQERNSATVRISHVVDASHAKRIVLTSFPAYKNISITRATEVKGAK
jgi:hypothetical protein